MMLTLQLHEELISVVADALACTCTRIYLLKTMTPVPPSLLISFFEAATASLNRPPDSAPSGHIPPSLDAQRQALLKIQVQSLQEAVSRYNDELGTVPEGITLQDAKEALKNSNFAVARGMEDAARCALVRAVLQAELAWDSWVVQQGSVENEERSRGLKDENDVNSMSLDSIKEFCGLFSAAVNLPVVEKYLRNGKDISFDGTTNDEQEDDSGESRLTPPERMEYSHLLLLRAVGYRAAFAKTSMQKLFFPGEEDGNDANSPDAELQEAFGNFLNATATAANKAAITSSSALQASTLSDGKTRVVSVQHSERTVSGEAVGGMSAITNDAVPLAQSMEEHDDERQRRQLAMARKAAALQQGLLNEVHAMEEIEREKILADAKDAHLSFLMRVSELPIGEERVHFLQSIDSDTQRLLAIHKLWEAQTP